MATVLEELSKTVADVAARVAPSVVGVGAAGSGVVVGTGLVVTNAHNIRRDEIVVTFADGRRADGRPAGVDVDGDLAVVAVDTGDAPALGVAGTPVRLGDAVLALANPGGRTVRVSVGFVSALDVTFRGPGGGRVRGAIEHTAPAGAWIVGRPRASTCAGHLVGIDTHRVGDGFYLALPADEELETRIEALSHGTCRADPDWESPSHPPGWRAGCGSRSACPSATDCSSTRSRRAAPPIVPACARATSWSAWPAPTSPRSTSSPPRSKARIPMPPSSCSWCGAPTRSRWRSTSAGRGTAHQGSA